MTPGQFLNRCRALASSPVSLKGRSGMLLLVFEVFVILSLSVSYYFAIKPYGYYGDHWSANTFAAYAEKNTFKDAPELFETWKGRLSGMLLTGALYDYSVKDNSLPAERVERFDQIFALYHALGLLLLFLAIMCALQNSLLINLGIFAGLIYNLSPANGPNFYPWDMPATLFFTLAVILHQRRQPILMLLVCCTGYFFKETVLASALLLFFNRDWPWKNKIIAFVVAVGVCFVGKKFLLSGMHLNTAVLSMADARSLSGLMNWTFLDRNILTILSTTANHVVFANAGTLVVMLLLVRHKRFQQYSLLIWAFVAAQMLYGTVKEFRIFEEVLPLSWILLMGYWKDWAQFRASPQVIESQPSTGTTMPDTTWAIRGTGKGFSELVVVLVGLTLVTVASRYRTMTEFRTPAQQLLTFEHVKKNAEKNKAEAQYDLGKHYLNGQGTTNNVDAACEWLAKAAKNGNTDAALLLAQTYADEHQPLNAINSYYWALGLDTNSLVALNGLAWIRATAVDPDLRNGAEAVRLARRAVLMSEEKEALLIGTLAAAYAEAGRFPDAVFTIDQACKKAVENNELEIAEMDTQMALIFKSGKPYHGDAGTYDLSPLPIEK